MADGDNPFNVSDKLAAPKKISQFEKARLEERQKRQRDDEELKQALGEYEDIFDDKRSSGARQYDDRSRHDFHEAKRSRFDDGHSGTQGPPPSLGQRRQMQALAEDRRRSRQSLSPDDSDYDDFASNRASRRSPDRSANKPTMLLQLLPKAVTEADVQAVIPDTLKVEDIRIVTPKDSRDADRYMMAYVSCSSSTPTSDLDKAVSQVQDKYIGYGCYVKASRYVASSGRLGNIDTSILDTNTKQLFGASERVIQQQPQGTQRDAPHSLSRMPPPSSFDRMAPAAPRVTTGPLTVMVAPPSDLRLLRIIHETAEQVIEHGADFEALLMAQPAVQRDEKWAWLFDSTSKASAYYRWLIWDRLCGDSGNQPGDFHLYDAGPIWSAPTAASKYDSVLGVEDVCQDDDYISSDEDDSDDDAPPRDKSGRKGGAILNIDEVGADAQASQYLNPARRAKLTYLLARMPDSIAMLRRGDIARVSHFVINNANNGAEEIIDMLISNLEHPFKYVVKYEDDDENNLAAPVRSPDEDKIEAEKQDCSGLQLIALYLISDVLLASSTAGVSNAWKYRNLFESALLARQVFQRLGRLEKVYSWGRMSAEKWKRKIMFVLDLWSDRSVFSIDALRTMKFDLMDSAATAERAEKTEEAKSKWITASAPAKEPAAEDIEADVARRTAAMQANIAAIKAKAAGLNAAPATAPDSTAFEPAAATPAPLEKQTSSGFSFAIGGGTPASSTKPAVSIGFSLKPTPKPSAAGKSNAGVFGDDDSE